MGDALSFFFDIVGRMIKFLWKPLSAFALPLGGISILLMTQVMAGATSVKAAEAAAFDKRGQLCSTLESESKVMDDLQAAGVNTENLAQLYDGFEDASGDPRLTAAMRYASQVEIATHAATETAEPEMAHKVTMAQRRVERINNARRIYTAAMVEWEESADTTRGRWAVKFGMAEPPP